MSVQWSKLIERLRAWSHGTQEAIALTPAGEDFALIPSKVLVRAGGEELRAQEGISKRAAGRWLFKVQDLVEREGAVVVGAKISTGIMVVAAEVVEKAEHPEAVLVGA